MRISKPTKSFNLFSMDKPGLQTLAIVAGALVVLLLPAGVTIMWQIWSKTIATLEKNTHAVIELRSKVEFILTLIEDFPKIKKDINAVHEKLRNRDKDGILEN